MKYFVSLCLVLSLYVSLNVYSASKGSALAGKDLESEVYHSKAGKKSFIEGTFLQPNSILSWDEKSFDRHIQQYKEIQFEHVILQWTEHYESSTGIRHIYYSSGVKEKKSDKDILTNLLIYGRKHKMKVYVGLNSSDRWWEAFAKSPAEFEEWWKAEAEETIRLADEIWAEYNHFAHSDQFNPFIGWYIPFEIDNISFASKEKQEVLCRQLAVITDHLKQKTGLPVMVSPFFYRSLEAISGPKEWKNMWKHILSQTGIDIIALQDGIGRRREFGSSEEVSREKAIANAKKWFSATLEAIEESGRKAELWANIETFTEVNYGGENKLVSSSIDRIVKQIKAESPYVTGITSFSFQAYQDSDKNHTLFRQYKEYVEQLKKGYQKAE